jgi:hypothetical protein
MRKDLDEALVADFPLTFRDRKRSARETPMGRGFEVGDGWEPIIRQAARIIEPHLDWGYVKKGLAPPTSIQVKEKFGTLRWYFQSEAFVAGVISLADAWSATVCEECGQPGILRDQDAWWKTVCDLHKKPT